MGDLPSQSQIQSNHLFIVTARWKRISYTN